MIVSALNPLFFKNNTQANIAVLTGGFITGATIQFNWAKNCLLQFGIGSCFTENWIRILTSALLCALLFWLLHKIVAIISKRLNVAEKSSVILHSNFFFASFSFLTLYFLFKPSTNVLIVLVSLIVLINVFHIFALVTARKEEQQYFKQIFFLFSIIVVSNLFVETSLLFFNRALNYYSYTQLLPASLIYLVLPALFPRIIKPYSILLSFLFFVASVPAISHILTYGAEMPTSAFYAIWETNSIEAADYIKQYLNLKILIFLLLLLVTILLLIRSIFRIKYQKTRFATRLVLGVCFLCLPFLGDALQYNVPNKFINSYLKYKSEIKLFINEIEKRSIQKPLEVVTCFEPDSALTVVVVIGESASKYHQGLYGYSRETNPLLNEIRDELYVFDDVVAPHSHTNPVLAKVLTFANHQNMDLLYLKPTIVEYMQSAGFKTFWLSNQEFSDQFTTMSSAIALQSDYYYFTFEKENASFCFDERLLKPFQLALNDKAQKKFIVLHLMGSHSDKTMRYPPEYNHFTTNEGIAPQSFHRPWPISVINAHDNSVLYNDWLLREFIEKIRIGQLNSVLLYFSDHGEELFEYRDFWGHAEANASIYMFDIPFVLWLSNKYKDENPDLVSHLNSYLTRKYQTDDVIHSIIDLVKCTSSDFEPQRSIFNASFKERKRVISNQDYDEMIKTKKSIDDTPLEKIRNNDTN